MTKENKLALVVGFALILLVGILVSDHFSTARTQQSADLLPASDPLVEATGSSPDLLTFQPTSPAAATDPATGSMTLPIEEAAQFTLASPETVPIIQMPDIQQTPTPAPARSSGVQPVAGSSAPPRFHDVRSGESLTIISRRYFGDEDHVRVIADLNGIKDPDMLRAGVRLKLPDIAGATPPARSDRPASRSPRPKTRTYTVRSGDVLTVIAQRELGSARLWQKLYELNKDVISDPDHLEVGTVLKFPGEAGG